MPDPFNSGPPTFGASREPKTEEAAHEALKLLGTRQIVTPEASIAPFSAEVLMAAMERIKHAPRVVHVRWRGPCDA